MAIQGRPQTELQGENVIVRPDLEALLEARFELGERRKDVGKVYRAKDEEAKGVIRALALDGPARCGRWIISTEERPGQRVEFETRPSSRIRIRPAKE